MSATPVVFDFNDYKAFLLERIRSSPQKGQRSRIARAAGCQSAYVSQVLNGHLQFSLEQGEAIGRYLALSEDEGEFFLMLIQKARAGTPSLRRHFDRRIDRILQARNQLKNRLKSEPTVSPADLTRYFMHWDIAAVHALFATQDFRTPEAIAARLSLPLPRVTDILAFLEATGQARKGPEGTYERGAARMHFGADHPVLPLFHRNWRLQAQLSLNREAQQDTHYTSVITLSEADVDRVKKLWTEWILQVKDITAATDPRDLHCLSFDFFRV
ncbi:MAG TPA: DUF4423 domain-containing protein [Bdellovibrionota bacterium]|nr:DUF4423 domain-containing protein [Bdellovibrionota bacterium]